MNAAVTVDVQNASSVVLVPDNDLIGDCIRQTIDVVRPDTKVPFEIAVRIVEEEESRDLNSRFRHVDRPTNVLAFPADDEQLAAMRGDMESHTLGDLVICGPVVLREAAEQAKNPRNHWLHLIVHGTLHLLGFDHQNEQEAAAMELLETRILAARGIDDPYGDQ